MNATPEPLPSFLAEPSRNGTELSVTGKWVPLGGSRRERRGSDQMRGMVRALRGLLAAARSDDGALSTQIAPGVGEDAALVHQVFAGPQDLARFYSSTAELDALKQVATPRLHLVRGLEVPDSAREGVLAEGVPAAFASHRFGYVRPERPDPATAIEVTAKWTCNPGAGDLAELARP